ncbi:MAG: type pili twitching motility protein PilT, partial [Mycetocola sp.]|nr:type pili twitching motility protein PilT [Mycetocola sp.]
MSDPIYEIPILAPGANVGGWTPGIRRRSRAEADASTALPDADAAAFAADASTSGYSVSSPTYSPLGYPAPSEPPTSRSELNRLAQEAATSAGRSQYGQPEPEPVALREFSLAEALHTVVRLKASDLHVTADAPPMIRVNGGLIAIEGAA